MSANGLDVFDRSINVTNAWLTKIMGDTGMERSARRWRRNGRCPPS